MSWGRFSDDIVQAWIDEIAAKTLYGALFYANPLVTDPLTVEVVGGGYVRPLMPTTRSAFNLLVNTPLLVWHNLSPGTHIAWVGAFDSPTGGTLQAAALLDTAVDLLSGGTWTLDAEQFAMGLDVATGP